MTENTYKCEKCGGVFEKGISDEDAIREAVEEFGNEIEVEIRNQTDEVGLICHDCYVEFENWLKGMRRLRREVYRK